MHPTKFLSAIAMLAALCHANAIHARPIAQGTSFTYQGQLKQSSAAVSGTADMQFLLFDASGSATQIGATQLANNVPVDSGQFTVTLDFGAGIFDGAQRWLEIRVRVPHDATDTLPYTTLSPRQLLTATPYALFALSTGIVPSTGLQGSYTSALTFSNAANTFTGNGAGLTGLNPGGLSPGTAGISITGNAATATAASTATTAITAGNVTGIVAVANGGTGASNAAAARTNLGAAAVSHTHDAADLVSGLLNIARLPNGGAWSLASNLNIDSNTLVIDQTNNRVGIGVTAPAAELEVRGDNGLAEIRVTPAIANSDSQIVLAENSAASGATILRHEGTLNQFQILGVNSTENGPWLTVGRDTGFVGIGTGTATPDTRLHVNGDVTIDGGITIASAARSLSISPLGFSATTPALDTGRNGSQLFASTPGQTVFFGAGLQLPDGAHVTGIELICSDNSGAQNVTMSLQRVNYDTGVGSIMQTVASAGSSASVQRISAGVATNTVDNSTFGYGLMINWTVPNPSSGITVQGARVTYTVTSPLP